MLGVVFGKVERRGVAVVVVVAEAVVVVEAVAVVEVAAVVAEVVASFKMRR